MRAENKVIVSVVMATYRRDEYLKKALNSLAAQEFRDFEIVLVDDNVDKEWNEKVSAIVSDFKNKNPEIKFCFAVNTENLGSAGTRNKGIDIAEGKYVTFLDDDDEYLPEKLKNQVALMEESSADFSVTDLSLYDNGGKLVDYRSRAYIKSFDNDDLLKAHIMYHLTGTDTFMFKREYIVAIGGFMPIDVGDEFYLMFKAIEYGGAFAYLPKCDVKAVVHSEDDGLSSGEKKIQGENAVYDFKKRYFGIFSRKELRYIKCRHYAVIAYANLRRKKIFRTLGYSIKGFFVSPYLFLKVLKSH